MSASNACNSSGCLRSRGNNKNGDDDDDDQSERSPEDEESNESSQQHGRRTHNLSIFDPPPTEFDLFLREVWKAIAALRKRWRKMINDEYEWSVFKSVLWFSIGLKLFRDIARNSAVLFGTDKCPPCPPVPSCPTINRCKIKN